MRELHEVLARARNSPFYRERLADADAAAWSRIPLTHKEDLRAAYPLGLLAVPLSEVASYHESSGTSGTPTASAFTEADWDDIAERFARNGVGLRKGDVVFVKTPYSMVTTAHQMHRAARRCGATVVPGDNRSSVMPYARVVHLLKTLPITVPWCMPTEALLWAEAARRAGLEPSRDFPALRAFCVAGEALTPAKKRRIAEIWGVPVFEDYGSTETGSLAGECAHGRMHLWSDRVLFEVIDGLLVVTPLYREAMPLVRYVTGDEAEISAEPCRCGSPAPTVRVRGRAGGGIAQTIEAAVYSLPSEDQVLFWRARRRGQGVEIQIAATPARAEGACAELTTRLAKTDWLAAAVTSVPIDTLLPPALFGEQSLFQKPRFVFEEHEDWDQAITYQGDKP